ncbi:ABC transporter permease [Paenibacillus daejeonensis]|uniref:ABC transporter permease n=1 Tax=Paenibacillus daejeonensis TaxID=135193 RepID=UPI0003786A78|nr:ABC transporter permease [Paenibacillus daejeonensis]
MMNANRLFVLRLKKYGTDQYRVWKGALDWTVWLYLIVPGLFIGGGTYLEIWQSPPSWLLQLPAGLYPAILIISLLLGRLRTFMEEADVLFLVQQRSWLRVLVLRGILYTFIVQMITTALLFVPLLPYLVRGLELSWEVIAIGYGWTVAFKMICSITANLMDAKWTGWRRHVIGTLWFILLVAIFVYGMLQWMSLSATAGLIGVGAAFAVITWLIGRKLASRSSLYSDIASEQDARLASTKLLLSQAAPVKPIGRQKKPLVMRRSGRLFRGSEPTVILAEMYVKSAIRQFGYVRLNLGFFSVSITAVLLSPLWLGIVLVLILPLLAGSWQRLQWQQWFSERFVVQFRWRDEDAADAMVRSKFLLLLPGVAILGLVAGFSWLGLWGGPLAMAGAVLSWWTTSRIPF